MAETTQQPSTANIAVACAILAGVTGYMLGQAKSLGLFGGSPIAQPAQAKKEKAADSSDDDSSSDEDDDSTPSEFPSHNEECKMVLVVRTDLGMTKGTTPRTHRASNPILTITRQDRRTMRTRHTGLLQALSAPLARLHHLAAVGTNGSGQGGAADQERRRA
jgi:hypothetical protein